ncbi:GMC family oxidoreductase N-terminal domain-containing protein [Aureliella helgolandensis]|uniref:Cholesterol oxidase n=1 Tax=Aureliella helgolandensis TaxID=2527968 RepID=A0A518G2Z0_9BACT|nr:GMC family oxidoreductase N-terminal domain-containing protein [Aureliella helgolandensis]QDV22966.1 Cholesterol oxidase precursor [Aureliella helgolandensis]
MGRYSGGTHFAPSTAVTENSSVSTPSVIVVDTGSNGLASKGALAVQSPLPQFEDMMRPRPLKNSTAAFGLERKRSELTRRSAVKLGAAAVVGSGGSVVSAAPVGGALRDFLGRRQSGPSILKQKAIEDYRANMLPLGGSLASPSQQLLRPIARGVPWQFEVLVIGSGYGAAVTAARLAPRLRPGQRMAVVERGREWVPGTFPDRFPDLLDAARLKPTGLKQGQLENPLGLFNVQRFQEIAVLSGSGLGGGSLINASVAYRPNRDVFCQAAWPVPLRSREVLDPYYELAEFELGVEREPWDHTAKMRAQRMAVERLAASGAHFEPARLAIQRASAELPVLNRQGMRQRGCTDCGDCLTGCNVGAKNTLANNYLPLARRAGCEIFTQTEVHRLEKCGDYYRIYFTHHAHDGQGALCQQHGMTTARVVVLSAGSLGSSEILLRSQSHQLQLTDQLGCRWTGNGDALGFIRNGQPAANIAGFSAYPDTGEPVGPIIETNLTYPHRSLAGRVLIQEGAAARSYANIASLLMRDLNLDDTRILLGMGHDGAAGRIQLDDQGYAEVHWPGLLESDYRKLIRGEFKRLAAAHGGQYHFLRLFGDRMISVHPLGGCAMADTPHSGVVNHQGQVFDAAHGGDIDPATGTHRVHTGLYVCDGAILPTSIACNPLLTITALAERNADLMLQSPQLADLFH